MIISLKIRSFYVSGTIILHFPPVNTGGMYPSDRMSINDVERKLGMKKTVPRRALD